MKIARRSFPLMTPVTAVAALALAGLSLTWVSAPALSVVRNKTLIRREPIDHWAITVGTKSLTLFQQLLVGGISREHDGLAKPLVRLIFSGLSKKWAENLAMLAGMGLFVVFNYFGQRFFAFRENKAE